MPLFRRRQDRALDAFDHLAERLDVAQRSLLAAIPRSRDPGIPLADALALFETGLDEVEELMPAWRGAAQPERFERCVTALAGARAEAERLRLDARPLEFEALNARVGDVLHPLEEFAQAEREMRAR